MKQSGNHKERTDDDFIVLLKGAVRENKLHTIPKADLLSIYRETRAIDRAQDVPDIELSTAINTLRDEISNRRYGKLRRCITKKSVLVVLALFVLVALAFIFRYDEEYIQGPLYRYDRFTSAVEVRRREVTVDDIVRGYGFPVPEAKRIVFKWVPLPQFKSLQHVRDVRTRIVVIQGGNNQGGNNNEELKRTIAEGNEKLKRNIEEGNEKSKRDNEELKRKVEDAESQRRSDEWAREQKERMERLLR